MSKRTTTAKARTVAKGHKHVKAAAAAHHAATGHAHKHHKAAKHHTTVRKHKGTVARGLAPAADQVACCAAEALAASLRLLGPSVSDADVLSLFWRAGGDAEAGVPVLAVLEAASASGLAGVRLAAVRHLDAPDFRLTGSLPLCRELHSDNTSLILGLDLPGPHTVLATPEGWWSWGELWCPCEWPDAVIEEAWAVTWR